MVLAGQWTSPYLWGFALRISAIFLYASVTVLVEGLPRERFRPPAPGLVLGCGSWWALIPAGVYCALILRRVLVEDQFLRTNLAGYDQYAGRVRHRVIPGVW